MKVNMNGQGHMTKMAAMAINTVQPHYNAPHYSAVFNITQPCHGSQINYCVIYLL